MDELVAIVALVTALANLARAGIELKRSTVKRESQTRGKDAEKEEGR